jgi:TolB-like protein
MSSIIEGYEYDIFISYRQKDNKHDGWVTEFVDNLKGELEATFKEDISIYFDENPSDGLLETYSVDKSLEGKLKCLIFIPVISQTYCDPNSYAWQHEFCAFNKLAKEDQFGRDIRLPNGNVASRILPVKIHDLDPEDKTLLENELGGVLRCIEFIYKSAGVNRPLRANEDHPQDNLNKTYYRDQINKVANAVKEIITALKKQSQHPEEASKQDFEVKQVHQKNHSTKIIAGTIIVLALIILGIFFIPKLFRPEEQLEKSIAVLPFKLLSDEPNKQYLADGMMDAITLHLSYIEDLRVLSRTSVEQYRQTDKTSSVIGRELNVAYLLEGSFQKFGDNVRLIVQLIKTGKEGHIWANNYDRNWNNVFSVQSEVAQTVAKELYASITPEEKLLIEKVPTGSMTAYELYLKANDYRKDYEKTRDLSSYQTAVNLYKAALEIDSAFAKVYSGLALAYITRYYSETYFKEYFLDSCLVLANKALSLDDKLDEAYYLIGRYYDNNGHIEEAIDNYDKALKINPNYYLPYLDKAYLFLWSLDDYINGLDTYHKALKLVSGDERQDVLSYLGRAYLDAGFIDKAKYYYQERLTLSGNEAIYFGNLAFIEFSLGNFEEALKLAMKANGIDSTYLHSLILYSVPPGHNEEAYIHAKKFLERYEKTGALNTVQSHRVGYALWQVGKKKEAENYFNQQIKIDEESIKRGRLIAQWNVAYYDIAGTYAFLGDKVKAYQFLDEFNKRSFYGLWWISLAKHDPLFASIRNEERFQKILQNMEAKYQAEHERVRKWLEDNNML